MSLFWSQKKTQGIKQRFQIDKSIGVICLFIRFVVYLNPIAP